MAIIVQLTLLIVHLINLLLLLLLKRKIYSNHIRHNMLETIERGHQIAYRELAARTELFYWTVDDHHDLDAEIGSSFLKV